MSVSVQWWWKLRARLGYSVARWMLQWPALVRQPRLWQWMEGQFSRQANLGDTQAQSFYGHVLLFRGQRAMRGGVYFIWRRRLAMLKRPISWACFACRALQSMRRMQRRPLTGGCGQPQ